MRIDLARITSTRATTTTIATKMTKTQQPATTITKQLVPHPQPRPKPMLKPTQTHKLLQKTNRRTARNMACEKGM